MNHATMSSNVGSIGQLHFIIISGFFETSKTWLSAGKGTVSKKIKEPSYEYESKTKTKTWKAVTEPKRAIYCSAVLLY